MSDAKFICTLFILLVAFFMTISTTFSEAVIMSVLLAWAMYNDYRYGRIKDRADTFVKAYDEMVRDMYKESDKYDNRK